MTLFNAACCALPASGNKFNLRRSVGSPAAGGLNHIDKDKVTVVQRRTGVWVGGQPHLRLQTVVNVEY